MLGSPAFRGGASAGDWTEWLLDRPFGRWLVGGLGLLVIATGLGLAAKGWSSKVERHLAVAERTRRWAVPLGRFGNTARGLVFALIGGFFLLAAWQADADQAKGLGQTLAFLQDQAYGKALLALAALGLAAFGAFGLVQARYRRIDPPDPGEAGTMVERLTS